MNTISECHRDEHEHNVTPENDIRWVYFCWRQIYIYKRSGLIWETTSIKSIWRYSSMPSWIGGGILGTIEGTEDAIINEWCILQAWVSICSWFLRIFFCYIIWTFHVGEAISLTLSLISHWMCKLCLLCISYILSKLYTIWLYTLGIKYFYIYLYRLCNKQTSMTTAL